MAPRARISGKRRTARTASQSPKKRIALRKSHLKKDIQSNKDDPPSEAKWATMASYGSFVSEYLTTSRVTS